MGRNNLRNRKDGRKKGRSKGGRFTRSYVSRPPRPSFGGFSRPPREMHKAICAECGKECEVPFKPTEGRPVYCRVCFVKRRGY